MINRYVKSGAEKEINISGDLRNRVLQQVEQLAEPAAAPSSAMTTPFDALDEEIRKLIRDSRYLEAFAQCAAQSISKQERRRRICFSVVTGLVSLVLFLGLLLGVPDHHTSRLARISTLVPNFLCLTLLLSSRLGI